MYQKLHRICDLLGFFSVNSWEFETTNTEILWKDLNEKDQQLFPFNMETLQWESYFKSCVLYGRIHLLNDPIDTLPQAKRKQKFIKLIYYCIGLALVYFLWRLI
ncbi:hypothetical protein Zmor_028116 [Zophobas morio]|uniref:Fatty acyl-CoA reductase C-terminal domain-containing protein n=1 Tax=Zophobas morio TaxID=2755281 RepID=A0AA38HPR0_9CUCU|nr:hypothetical protein Zmor_028116 [Zophobas morio]